MKNRFKNSRDLGFDRMFETRSEAWERVGLAVNVSQRAVKRARREAAVLIPLLIAVLVLYYDRHQIFGISKDSPWNSWIRAFTVLALLALGWTIARDVGRAAGPTFFRRMDPATAGSVGFLIRLVTIVIVLIVALRIAAVDPSTLVAGTAFTAVILGLAAQQTLGNLFAGLVLLTARPFRVGERVRLQSGPIGGIQEGIVSSLGLMYTTLARGQDQIMIPNNGVLSSVVVPLKEPDSVDVRVRLSSGVRPSQVQALLDDQISTPTRAAATVLLEEIDGDDLVVRVQATPEKANEGAQLADEIIMTLASVTSEHQVITDQPPQEGAKPRSTADGDDENSGQRIPTRDQQTSSHDAPPGSSLSGPQPTGGPSGGSESAAGESAVGGQGHGRREFTARRRDPASSRRDRG